jgi:hypothetical protein
MFIMTTVHIPISASQSIDVSLAFLSSACSEFSQIYIALLFHGIWHLFRMISSRSFYKFLRWSQFGRFFCSLLKFIIILHEHHWCIRISIAAIFSDSHQLDAFIADIHHIFIARHIFIHFLLHAKVFLLTEKIIELRWSHLISFHAGVSLVLKIDLVFLNGVHRGHWVDCRRWLVWSVWVENVLVGICI